MNCVGEWDCYWCCRCRLFTLLSSLSTVKLKINNHRNAHNDEMNCLTFKLWLTLSHTSSWNYIKQKSLLAKCASDWVNEWVNERVSEWVSVCGAGQSCWVYSYWHWHFVSYCKYVMRRICYGLFVFSVVAVAVVFFFVLWMCEFAPRNIVARWGHVGAVTLLVLLLFLISATHSENNKL